MPCGPETQGLQPQSPRQTPRRRATATIAFDSRAAARHNLGGQGRDAETLERVQDAHAGPGKTQPFEWLAAERPGVMQNRTTLPIDIVERCQLPRHRSDRPVRHGQQDQPAAFDTDAQARRRLCAPRVSAQGARR
jgi:hypothetical protein